MNPLSVKLGFWSSLSSLATFIIFTICFIGSFIVNPVFTWTNLTDYVAYVNTHDQFFKSLAQASMLLFASLYVLLLISIHDYAHQSKKVISRAALCVGLMFSLLVSTHYFVQLTAVRLNILKGSITGLEQFVQGNPSSALAAANMLGWTFFFGLSCFFTAPVFSGGKTEKILRFLFLLNGTFCFLGGIGYIFDSIVLIFLTVNFGMGGAVIAITSFLCIFFKKKRTS